MAGWERVVGVWGDDNRENLGPGVHHGTRMLSTDHCDTLTSLATSLVLLVPFTTMSGQRWWQWCVEGETEAVCSWELSLLEAVIPVND